MSTLAGALSGRAAVWACTALMLSSGGAFAGACVDTRRGDQAFSSPTLSADTSIHNEMQDLSLQVEIYKDDKIKVQRSLQPGESASHLAKFGHGDNVGGRIRVVVYPPENAFRASDCNYLVHYGMGRTTWKLQEGDEAVCVVGDLVDIGCDKSFHSGKLRWNTTFRITD